MQTIDVTEEFIDAFKKKKKLGNHSRIFSSFLISLNFEKLLEFIPFDNFLFLKKLKFTNS